MESWLRIRVSFTRIRIRPSRKSRIRPKSKNLILPWKKTGPDPTLKKIPRSRSDQCVALISSWFYKVETGFLSGQELAGYWARSCSTALFTTLARIRTSQYRFSGTIRLGEQCNPPHRLLLVHVKTDNKSIIWNMHAYFFKYRNFNRTPEPIVRISSFSFCGIF